LCPGTQRCVDQGSDTTLGLAAETSAAVKAPKYADLDNFIPLTLETGGRVNKAAFEWLGTLTAPRARRRGAQSGRRKEPARIVVDIRSTASPSRMNRTSSACLDNAHVFPRCT
jgi:hypothetical protein